MKKVALIVGGSDGLGRAIAAYLYKEDYEVIVWGKDSNNTEITAKEIGVDFVVADVVNPVSVKDTVQAVVSKYGRIDVLINCAGVWIQGPIEESDDALMKAAMDVNAYGTMLVTKYVVPEMKKQKSGKIINVISQGGLYPKADRSVYTASKWAVTGFTKSLQLELGKFGIAVSGFYPGPMRTNFFKKVGIDKNMTGYMDVEEVAKSLKVILELPNEFTIPELGIKPLE